jgi:hypothetical protein
MHVQLPNNITDLSITFFAGGRPHEIQRSHKNFDLVRSQILDWNKGERSEADVTALINLADPKQELLAASGGRLEFAGNEIRYGGVALHNLWVDKIIGFKDAGEEFGPIFLALEDLQKNPTPAARERLPIFVERSKLGFLPDGRIAAFKGVRDDFYDVHSGTVHYGIGKTVAMDRSACNANPDQTCSTGLHVGAIDYINKNGFGWNHGSNRRMLLTAFWPRHVVAVPTDYAGGKMRVEQLTVLDEVDKGYVTELLSKGTLMIRGYEIDTPTDTGVEPEDAGDDIEGTEDAASKTDPTTPAGKAKVGDWIYVDGDDTVEDGDYLVVAVDEVDNGGQRLTVKTGAGVSDIEDVNDDAVSRILDEAPGWARAKVGDWVKDDSSEIPRLVTEVDDKDLYFDGSRLKVRDFDSDDWMNNSDFEELLTSPPDVWLRVIEDDIVRIEGHPLFRDGEYPIYSMDTYNNHDADGDLYEITAGDDQYSIRNDLIKSIKREVEEAQAAGVAAAAAAAALEPAYLRAKVGDTVRVLEGQDHTAGDFRVVRVSDGDPSYRVAVAYQSYDRWWIANNVITEIVTAEAATAAVPVAPAEPAWKRAKVGDIVTIRNGRQRDGNYEVERVHADDSVGRRLRVKNPGGNVWADNGSVVDIVTPVAPVAAPTSITFEAAKAMKVGERVQLKGHGDVPDGIYPITDIDRDDSTVTLRIEKAGGIERWVRNESVFQLVTAPASVPPVGTRPAYERAKIGDRVRVEGASTVLDGVYEVTQIDEGDSMRLKVRIATGGSTWISNSRVKDVVVPTPVADTRPLWEQIEVGDVVLVEGSRFANGELPVAKTQAESSLTGAEKEKYAFQQANGVGYWIEKSAVKRIVRKANAKAA